LTALNTQTSDRTVVPVLKAGPQPGTVDLALRVADHLPLHGSVELNNQYTADTSHLRAVAAMSYDNLFGRLDSLALQYQAAPESVKQSHVIAGSYTMRLGADGSSLSFQYVDSKSDVATIGTLGVLGTGSVFGVRLLEPLPTTSVIQSFALEADYKDFTQSILVNPSTGLNTPIKYINLSGAYSGIRSFQQRQFDWSTTLNFGLRGIIDNTMQFADKRFGAQPNYFYLRTDGGFKTSLPAQFSAAVRLSAQYAIDPLVSNEQFSVGGANSVRGYLEAEELGDSGARAAFQFGLPPLNLASGAIHLNEFLFYDLAHTYVLDALPGQAFTSDLRSWGAGVKIDAFGHFDGTLTWADPLQTGSRTNKGASTLLFLVRGTW